MCARADAKIVAEAPIVQIVPRLLPRLGERRSLVVLVTCSSQHALDLFLHRGREFIVGHFGGMAMEERIRFDGQVIGGDMRRRHCDRGRDVRLCLLQGLGWQRIHQIQVEVVEDRLRDLHGTPRLGLVVDTSQCFQVAAD